MIREPVRAVEPSLRDRPRQQRANVCGAFNCGNLTRGRKPYCTQHILKHEYAMQVAKREAAARAEVERVCTTPRARVDMNGVVVEDLLTELGECPRTIAGLDDAVIYFTGRRTLDGRRAVVHYVNALRRAGLVTVLGVTPRGLEQIGLAPGVGQ